MYTVTICVLLKNHLMKAYWAETLCELINKIFVYVTLTPSFLFWMQEAGLIP
jgi:hypothetical protein